MRIGLNPDKKKLIIINSKPIEKNQPIMIPIEQIKELIRKK